MGGVASQVEVNIVFEHLEAVVAGTALKGTVYVNVLKPINATGFILKVKGKEETAVQYTESYTDSQGHSHTRTHTDHDSCTFLESKIQMNSQHIGDNNMIQQGRYEHPFIFELSKSLPSTMNFSSGSEYCRILYYVKLQIVLPNGKEKDANKKFPFIVKTASSNNINTSNPILIGPNSQPVNFCCCFNKGSVVAGANVMKSIVHMNETIPVQFECMNESTVNINSINVVVNQTVKWSAKHHSTSSKKTLFHKDVQDELKSRMTSSLVKREKYEVARSTKEGYSHLTDKLLKAINDGENIFYVENFNISNMCLESYHGRLIQTTHFLEIIVKLPICVSNVNLRCPLQIVGAPNSITSSQNTSSSVYAPPAPTAPPADWSGATIGSVMQPSAPPPVMYNIHNSGYTNDNANHQAYTFTSLLQQMNNALLDYVFVEDTAKDPNWNHVYAEMTPMEFGQIIKNTKMDFDQIKVAELIAPSVSAFTCNHCVAAIRSCASYSRQSIIQKVLPYCQDITTGKDSILAELTNWEKISTELYFRDALDKASKH